MFSVEVSKTSEISIVQIPEPVPGDYEAVVRVEVGYLCNATDSEIISRKLPQVSSYPTLLGHENAGTVIETGKKVQSYKEGDRIAGGLLLNPTKEGYSTGFGGFSEFVIATDYAAMLADGLIKEKRGDDIVSKIMRVIPPDIPAEAAGLFCMWREVLGCIMDLKLNTANGILVFGGGPVGLSFIRFAKLMGVHYTALVDNHEEKQALARRFGADETFRKNDNRLDHIERGGTQPIDLVIDAVGKPDILKRAVKIIPEQGRICVYGLYEDGEVYFNVKHAPSNWDLLYHQWPLRDAEAASQEQLVEWIRQGDLNWNDFVSSDYPIADIMKGVDDIRSRKAVKVLLRYP